MMKIVRSATIDGATATDAIVSVDELDGHANFHVNGQGEEKGRETAKRVAQSLSQIGMEPNWRNLGIEIRPHSSGNDDLHDLPIALGILALENKVPDLDLTRTLCVGGLTSDGGIIGCPGMYAIAVLAADKHLDLVAPSENEREVRMGYRAKPIMASRLENLVDALGGPEAKHPDPYHDVFERREETFIDIEGWEDAKVALEIATCGRHHLGLAYEENKPAIALIRRAPRLLPFPGAHDANQILTIYSLAGITALDAVGTNLRTFRAPHHSATRAAICGTVIRETDNKTGRCRARPGELSLAHGGVLLVDNPQEWKPEQLEDIAHAAEKRETTAEGTPMPANCIVMVTTQVEPGNNWLETLRSVHALGEKLHMAFHLNEQGKVRNKVENARDQDSRERRVERADRVQRQRYEGEVRNGNASEEIFAARATLTNEAVDALKNAGQSNRGPTARVARTIADLRESKETGVTDVEQALCYKP